MSELANALIVVDVQKDFCPGGSLAVEHGDEIAGEIHTFLCAHTDEYIAVVATKCWHPSPEENPDFDHFSDQPNFVNTWPPHCVAGTEGAGFHDNLGAFEHATWRSQHGVRNTPIGDVFEFDKVFYKGQQHAAYSGFEGADMQMDERTVKEIGANPFLLNSYLGRLKIGHVDVVGIATDYCVFATAMDAKSLGYDTTVFVDLCAGVNATTTLTALEQMVETGIHVERTGGEISGTVD